MTKRDLFLKTFLITSIITILIWGISLQIYKVVPLLIGLIAFWILTPLFLIIGYFSKRVKQRSLLKLSFVWISSILSIIVSVLFIRGTSQNRDDRTRRFCDAEIAVLDSIYQATGSYPKALPSSHAIPHNLYEINYTSDDSTFTLKYYLNGMPDECLYASKNRYWMYLD